jgi:diacylglycerol kinase
MFHRHTISFKHAFDGLIWALKTQPNYKIHLVLSLLALFSSWFFHISEIEFIVIIFLISVGLVIETINTSIEATTDAIDNKWREDIKLAKDLSAAAMLIFACGAFLISCIIFVPKISAFLHL